MTIIQGFSIEWIRSTNETHTAFKHIVKTVNSKNTLLYCLTSDHGKKDLSDIAADIAALSLSNYTIYKQSMS